MEKKTLKLWSLEEIYPSAKTYLERLFHDLDGDYYRLGTGKYLKFGDMYWGLSFVPYYTGTGYAPACVLRGGVMADDPPSAFADLVIASQFYCYMHKFYDLKAFKEALDFLKDRETEELYVATALIELYELMKNNDLYRLKVEGRFHAFHSFRPKEPDVLKDIDTSWFVIEIMPKITSLGHTFFSFVLQAPYVVYTKLDGENYNNEKVHALIAEYKKREDLQMFAKFIRSRETEFKEFFLKFPFTNYLWESKAIEQILGRVFIG